MRAVNAIATVERAPEIVAQKAAPRIAAALEEQYELGLDPYGAPWAPLAASTLKRHGPPPLTDTGAMRRSTDAVSAGAQIIATAQEPAEFHQGGTSQGLPARPILPNANHGLPQTWETALLDAGAEIEAEIQKAVNAA